MKYGTIPEMFFRTCDKYGAEKTAFSYKKGDEWIALNYEEIRDRVEAFALGLLELGVRKGDRIGIVSENRLEWIIASFAISIIGAVDVPVFPILTAKQEEFVYSNCQASAIIVSNNFQLHKVMEFRDAVESLRHIIVMNKEFTCEDITVKSMDELITRGCTIKTKTERRELIKSISSRLSEDDLVTVIYTSGTTGNPKGVKLSHKNLIADYTGAVERIGKHRLEHKKALCFLPLCHCYERTAGLNAFFSQGVTIYLAESFDAVSRNLLEVQPNLMTVVPKVLETIKKKMLSAIDKEPTSKRMMIKKSIEAGLKYVRAKQNGRVGPIIATENAIAEKLVLSKLREKLGSSMEMLVSGGAAMSEDVQEFFMAMGVNVVQGYGLTEASPAISITSIEELEIGTIGKPFFNIEVKIAEDGEILVRGPIVMQGYWNDPVATEEAIDADGWLYTGDIGMFTEKGNLKITDRKKNIFVSSGGKNIAPQPIENLLTQSRFIDQCFLIGERREYCTALLTPNFEQLRALAQEFGIHETDGNSLVQNPKIINYIKKEIDYLQKDLSKFEKVRKFNLLPQPFSVETGELSPKMSVRRHVVESNYSALIEKMYGDD